MLQFTITTALKDLLVHVLVARFMTCRLLGISVSSIHAVSVARFGITWPQPIPAGCIQTAATFFVNLAWFNQKYLKNLQCIKPFCSNDSSAGQFFSELSIKSELSAPNVGQILKAPSNEALHVVPKNVLSEHAAAKDKLAICLEDLQQTSEHLSTIDSCSPSELMNFRIKATTCKAVVNNGLRLFLPIIYNVCMRKA